MTRADDITDALRQDILRGRFEPGDRLLEVALAEHYDVGRAAIRSSLVALTAEGLVVREANRGATVRRISITEARSALESLIASRAAENSTESTHAELRQIIADMEIAADTNARDYSELNARLHGCLRAMSGHHIAASLVANLRDRAAHHQYRLALMPGRPHESLEQHRRIVDAVIAGDAEEAGRAMAEHLSSVTEVLRRWSDATP